MSRPCSSRAADPPSCILAFCENEGVEGLKDDELKGKVCGAMHRQCRDRGYAAPADVLIEVGALSKAKYEEWRFGRVDYLERVCTLTLRQLSLVLREMASCAKERGLKPSRCCYKQWGVKKKFGQKGPVVKLRFSKSEDPNVERAYATHYVDCIRVEELKSEKKPDQGRDSARERD